MRAGNTYMINKKGELSDTELKQLAIQIKEHGPNVCIRVRMIGQMWLAHFCRVITVTQGRMLLNDEVKNKLFSIVYAMSCSSNSIADFSSLNHISIIALFLQTDQ